MEPTVLITGRQSSFTDDLLQETLSRGFKVFATYDPAGEEPEVPDGFGNDLTYIEWNQRSPISARSVLLEAENSADSLDEVFVVFGTQPITLPFHETPASRVEEIVDGAVKGYLFMLREALGLALRRGAGNVNILTQDRSSGVVPPLEAAAAGAFLSAARALMTYYEEEPLLIRGFHSSGKEGREFARYVLDTIRDKGDKSAGRWNKFGGRGSLFPFRK